MSETGHGARPWRFYVSDMIECCEKVRAWTAGLDRATFVSDDRTYDATLRNLELIGEAATHVPKAVRAAHPEIPWRSIIATRNRLIHSYVNSATATKRAGATPPSPALARLPRPKDAPHPASVRERRPRQKSPPRAFRPGGGHPLTAPLVMPFASGGPMAVAERQRERLSPMRAAIPAA